MILRKKIFKNRTHKLKLKKIRRRLVKIMEEFEQTQPLPQADLIE